MTLQTDPLSISIRIRYPNSLELKSLDRLVFLSVCGQEYVKLHVLVLTSFTNKERMPYSLLEDIANRFLVYIDTHSLSKLSLGVKSLNRLVSLSVCGQEHCTNYTF